MDHLCGLVACLLTLAWSPPLGSAALVIGPSQVLTPPDPVEGMTFGIEIAVKANVAVIGAPEDSEAADLAGAAYVYEWSQATATWNFVTKLTASDAEMFDFFGSSVATDGVTIVVGAENDVHDGINSGSSYVFRKEGGVWSEEVKLVPNDGSDSDFFGASAGVDGDLIAVGAPRVDLPGIFGMTHGAVYVFRRVGSSWVYEAKLWVLDSPSGYSYGLRLSVSGERIAGSSLWREITVFRNIAGAWEPDPAIAGPVVSTSDEFGKRVAIDGNRLVVSATSDDEAALNAGAAYVYRQNSDTWELEQKIIRESAFEGERFGAWVSVEAEVMAIASCPGPSPIAPDPPVATAYVYRWRGAQWREDYELEPVDAIPEDLYGVGIGVSEGRVLIGASGDQVGGVASGRAFAFHLDRPFQRGDCNADTSIDLGDAIGLLASLFLPGTPGPGCESACDTNDDGALDISDPLYLLGHLFILGSPPPLVPFGLCGDDPTDDVLTCAVFDSCP